MGSSRSLPSTGGRFSMGGGGGGNSPIITEDMRAAAEVAAKQWNDYKTRFVPFENKFIADVSRDPKETKAFSQGATNADIAQMTPAAALNPTRSGAGTTVDASARAGAAGQVEAAQGALNRTAQGLGTAVTMGRGQQVEALDSMMSQAETSGQVALKKQIADNAAKTSERGNYMKMAAGALNGAAGYYNSGNPDSVMNQSDVAAGASSDPSGYSIVNGNPQWNDGASNKTLMSEFSGVKHQGEWWGGSN